MPEGPCTILGGLPVIAEVWFSRGDGWMTDDDAGVDRLFWRKRDGSKGKEVSQKIYNRLDKEDYWECDVIDQVSDHLAYEQWIRSQAREGESWDATERRLSAGAPATNPAGDLFTDPVPLREGEAAVVGGDPHPRQ